MSNPQVGSPQNAFPDGPGSDDCGGLPGGDLLALALAPESMKNADQEYKERSIADLITLDKYLRSKNCVSPATAGWGSMRVSRVVPPDSVGPK